MIEKMGEPGSACRYLTKMRPYNEPETKPLGAASNPVVRALIMNSQVALGQSVPVMLTAPRVPKEHPSSEGRHDTRDLQIRQGRNTVLSGSPQVRYRAGPMAKRRSAS